MNTLKLDRSLFHLTGPDTVRYLNGQISQDVKLCSHDRALYTAITNAKGKMQGDGYIRSFQNGILLDTPLSLREDMFQRLDMYLIADDVTIEDITELYHLYHSESKLPDLDQYICQRFGFEGHDSILPSTSSVDSSINPDHYESLRILTGVPLWGNELDENTLPPEAGIEKTAISYNKGCYIGQEVISRIKSAGKTNRSISCFSLSQAVEPNTPLYTDASSLESKPEKPSGMLTSCCDREGHFIGLGYIARKSSEVIEFITPCGAQIKVRSAGGLK